MAANTVANTIASERLREGVTPGSVTSRVGRLACVGAGVALLVAQPASAQWWDSSPGKRTGKWETSIGAYFTGSESSDGTNDASVDVDAGYGVSFGLGYNFSEHLALSFDGAWSRADYDAVLDTEDEGPVAISHRLSLWTGQFNGIYNIVEGPFTPYVQAGIGWTYVDSNVADGPPSTGCWWDPWWGYICAPFYSTNTETNFAWNVGAGLRYELRGGTFLRGGWERTQIDGRSGADLSFDALRVQIGWLF
jgi:opacity protein-like surface antigen